MTDAVHNHTTQSIAHLAALMHLYLLQEYSLDTWLPTDRDTFLHFRHQAIERKKQQSILKTEPIRAQNGPPPPPPIVEEEVMPVLIPKDVIKEPLSSAKNAILPPKSAIQSTLATATQSKIAIVAPQPPHSQQILLEPVATPSVIDFSSIQACFTKLFPHYPLMTTIPTDAHAQHLSLLWKQDPVQKAAVIILTLDPSNEEKQLLSRLSAAMEKQSVLAIVLDSKKWEEETGWGSLLESASLKLIVAAPSCLTQLPKLQSYYRAVGNDYYLLNVRLLVSEEIKSYIQEPKRKNALWQSLCALMPSLLQQ